MKKRIRDHQYGIDLFHANLKFCPDEPKIGQYSVIEAAIHNEKWDFEDFNLQHLGLNIIRLEVPT